MVMSEPISRRALLAGAGASVLLAGCSRGPIFIGSEWCDRGGG